MHVLMTPEARNDTDHFFGENNDHIREELKGHTPDKSEVHKSIERHLKQEIDHDSYNRGHIKDKYGRPARLGRIIKDKKLVHEFSQDNTRSGSRKIQKPYVTVVRGTEVAGQTNSRSNKEHPDGHAWNSCKDVDSGSCKKGILDNEIKYGSVVVRVHDHSGKEIHRSTLQPHKNDAGHSAYFVDSSYGVDHPSYVAHVHDVAQRLSGEHKGGSIVYKKHPNVFNDNERHYSIHHNATPEHINTALGEYSRDFHASSNIRRAAAEHPNATPEHLHTALRDRDSDVRVAAAEHPNATPEHLHKALGDNNRWVRVAAASHPSATPEHLHKALGDRDEWVRETAAKHQSATPEHINTALRDDDEWVRKAAASHPNAPKNR